MGTESRTALVVHPRLDLWAGGEYIALQTIKALVKDGYKVVLACDRLDLDGADKTWEEGGDILELCEYIPLPKLWFDRGRSIQRLAHVKQVRNRLGKLEPDVVFNTQPSTYLMPNARTVEFVYHHGDLLYYWGNRLASKREFYYSFIRLVRGLQTDQSDQTRKPEAITNEA